MRHVAQHELVIVAVSIRALTDELERMVRQLPQERAVASMTHVLRANFGLKHLGNADAESPSMWLPANELGVFFLRKDVVHLLGEGHLRNVSRNRISRFRWYRRTVPVGMVHKGARLLDDLDDAWFDRELGILFASRSRMSSMSGIAHCLHGTCLHSRSSCSSSCGHARLG